MPSIIRWQTEAVTQWH